MSDQLTPHNHQLIRLNTCGGAAVDNRYSPPRIPTPDTVGRSAWAQCTPN
jgi:hypothetical protein